MFNFEQIQHELNQTENYLLNNETRLSKDGYSLRFQRNNEKNSDNERSQSISQQDSHHRVVAVENPSRYR